MKKAIIALLVICTAVFAQQKGTGTFTDPRDKKKYKTVDIGGLTWMAENLSYNAKGQECPDVTSHLSMDDRKSIPCTSKNGVCINVKCIEWREDSDFQPFCVEYKNLTAKEIQDRDKRVKAKCAEEGWKYYQHNDVCPAGWHLPNDKEWEILQYEIRNSTDEYGFKDVSNFKVVSFGSVRCVQGKSSEEAIAEAEKKVAAEKEANEKAEAEKATGKQFNPKINYGSMTDPRDKTTYKTTKIGGQTWMAENLNYNANGSKCYRDKDYYCKKDGRLYDWETAKTACPAGWHLPTKGEWATLENTVGGSSAAKTKLITASGWLESGSDKPINGTDDFGFSAVSAGSSGLDGKDYSPSAKDSWWWSASEGSSKIGYGYRISNLIGSFSGTRTSLYNVRCVQGEAPKEEPAPAPAPANSPSKTMYCVSYVTGKPVSCLEIKSTLDSKKICDTQNKSMKMMFGEAKLTETKPSIKCDK